MAQPTAPDTNPAEGNAKPSRAPYILGIVALIAIVWGGKTVLYNRKHATTDNAQVDGTIVPVLAKVGGYVASVRVVENQAAKGGDLLVVLDRKSTRLNSSHVALSRMPSSA